MDHLELFDKLSNREVTGNEAISLVEQTMSQLSEKSQKVLTLILSRSFDCGMSEKTINKVWKKLIPEFGVMLCSPLNDKTRKLIKTPFIAQVKYDASRCIAIVHQNEVVFKTRNGKEMIIENNRLKSELIKIASHYNDNKGVVLDGEIMIEGADRQGSNKIVTKFVRESANKDEANLVHFKVWDVIPKTDFLNGKYSVEYGTRFDELQKLYCQASNDTDIKHVSLAETKIMANYEEAHAWCLELMLQGEEGIIIKNIKGAWKNSRSREQFKVKAVMESDMRITKLVYGTGKYKDALGAFECESSDGLVKVSVGSGLKDDERQEKFHPSTEANWIGKIMVVRHNGMVTDNKGAHSLYLPRFVEVRLDKDEADDLTKIKAEMHIG